jgi:hypothetical protein
MAPTTLAILLMMAASVDPKSVIVTADPRMVTKCTAAGEVSARSYGELAGQGWAELGAERIREGLIKSATELDANVVLVQKASSVFVASVKGTAYRCTDEALAAAGAATRKAEERSQRRGLPERAFDIETGFIGIQAGVALRPEKPDRERGKATVYLLFVRNESESSVLAAATLSYAEKPFEASRVIGPHEMAPMTWYSYGVSADRDIPLQISIFSDWKRDRLLGKEETAMFFPSSDVKPLFEDSRRLARNQAFIVAGWKEMMNKPVRVEGTAAGEDLQRDIVWTLYREESKTHRDCAHSVAGAVSQQLDAAALAARFPKAKPEMIDFFAARKGASERWTVQSCDAVTAYDILLFPDAEGGTDILVNRVKE